MYPLVNRRRYFLDEVALRGEHLVPRQVHLAFFLGVDQEAATEFLEAFEGKFHPMMFFVTTRTSREDDSNSIRPAARSSRAHFSDHSRRTPRSVAALRRHPTIDSSLSSSICTISHHSRRCAIGVSECSQIFIEQ